MALMSKIKSDSERNIVRYLNKVMDNPYRRGCLGWKPNPVEIDRYYSVDWDDDDTTRTPVAEPNRVEIEYASGEKRTPSESTSYIYTMANNIIRCAKVGDLVGRDVKAVQSLADFENLLKDLVSKNEDKDSAVEKDIRQKFIESDGIDDNPDIELWRLLLKKRVDNTNNTKATCHS